MLYKFYSINEIKQHFFKESISWIISCGSYYTQDKDEFKKCIKTFSSISAPEKYIVITDSLYKWSLLADKKSKKQADEISETMSNRLTRWILELSNLTQDRIIYWDQVKENDSYKFYNQRFENLSEEQKMFIYQWQVESYYKNRQLKVEPISEINEKRKRRIEYMVQYFIEEVATIYFPCFEDKNKKAINSILYFPGKDGENMFRKLEEIENLLDVGDNPYKFYLINKS